MTASIDQQDELYYLLCMAHTNPHNVELTHQFNKIIKKGKSRKPLSDEIASRDRSTFSNIDGKVLDKPIQIYRMWYRFLQLALELEEKKVQIVTRMKIVELKKPKKDKWGKLRTSESVPVHQKVKVNRKIYASWNLDIIPTTSFDDWWFGKKGGNEQEHKELFYPDNSVVVLKDKNDWVDDSNYTYIRVDKRRRMNDVVNDLRMMFANQDRSAESISAFPITGYPNINTLINRYNALILQLTTTLRDKEILASDVFRKTETGMGDKDSDAAYSYRGSPGRVMRDLMLPAKIALLSVADGHFVKNPAKDYLMLSEQEKQEKAKPTKSSIPVKSSRGMTERIIAKVKDNPTKKRG